MKKLVTAACALVAGMALAQVQSTNVVGYQNLQSASFQLVTPNFVKMDGTSWKLSDLAPAGAGWDFNSDKINCYNGASLAFEATYLTAADIASIAADNEWMDGQTWVAGWYNFGDVGDWGENGTMRCYNDTEIPFGASGFAVESAVGVRFFGEVKAEAQTLVSASFQLVGNCSPVAITLADIVPAGAGWDYNSDKINCYDGASLAFEATYLTASDIASIAADNEWMDGQTWAAGWYNFGDVGDWGENGTMRCYNSTAIPAGFGFAVESSVGVVIPSAL